MSFTKEQESYFEEMLDVLDECNALKHVILAGSWAEYLYEKEGILEGFVSVAKTTDIDFILNENKKEKKAISIIGPAQEKGFLYEEDYITGVSKFRKKDFEVEFLISQNGDGRKPVPKNSLGITAQQLTHLDFVKDNCFTIEHNGHDIIIPKPEVYVIQKMVINDRRKNKAGEDRKKIRNLIPYLNKKKFDYIFEQLSRKEKAKVNNYIGKYHVEFKKELNKKEKDVIQIYKKIQEHSIRVVPSFIMLCGLPGVGKSEIAAKEAQRFRDLGCTEIAIDSFLNNEVSKSSCEDPAFVIVSLSNIKSWAERIGDPMLKCEDFEIAKQVTSFALNHGVSVIYDACNLRKETRTSFVEALSNINIKNKELIIVNPANFDEMPKPAYLKKISDNDWSRMKSILIESPPSKEDGWDKISEIQTEPVYEIEQDQFEISENDQDLWDFRF